MRRIQRQGAALVLAALMLVAVAAIAVAAGKGPKTDEAKATFTAKLVDQKSKTCTGEDGAYADNREVYTGTITGDPELSGDLKVRVHSLVNTDTGLGTSRGKVEIRDTATHKVKAHGKYEAVVTEGAELEGFLDAHVHPAGEPPRRDGRLWANFHATGKEDGSVSGALGDGAGANTAVVQSGRCGGPKSDHKPKPKPHPKPHPKPDHKPKPKPKG
jgi:hypothetical protein